MVFLPFLFRFGPPRATGLPETDSPTMKTGGFLAKPVLWGPDSWRFSVSESGTHTKTSFVKNGGPVKENRTPRKLHLVMIWLVGCSDKWLYIPAVLQRVRNLQLSVVWGKASRRSEARQRRVRSASEAEKRSGEAKRRNEAEKRSGEAKRVSQANQPSE